MGLYTHVPTTTSHGLSNKVGLWGYTASFSEPSYILPLMLLGAKTPLSGGKTFIFPQHPRGESLRHASEEV